ncbi:hypothetical protein D3C78_1306650 [compost metagenome]
MGVVVIGDGWFATDNIPFKTMDGQVHLAQAGRYTVFFVPVEGQLVRVFFVDFQEVRALHEHAAGTARGVKDDAVIRLQHIGDELHEGNRGKEFTAVMSPLVGKFGQEIFVDTAKDVTGGLFQLIRVQSSQ